MLLAFSPGNKAQVCKGYKKRVNDHKAHLATHFIESFTFNLVALLNDFENYLHDRHGQEKKIQDGVDSQGHDQSIALLSHFVGFLIDADPKTG